MTRWPGPSLSNDHNFDPAVTEGRHAVVWFTFQPEAHWRSAYTELCSDRDSLYMDAIRNRIAKLGAAPAEAEVLGRYRQDITFSSPTLGSIARPRASPADGSWRLSCRSIIDEMSPNERQDRFFALIPA